MVELLVALAVLGLLVSIAFGLFQLLVGSRGAQGIAGRSAHSFLLKDAQAGFRAIAARIRECQQILEPLPGRGGSVLVVRELSDRVVRYRLDDSGTRLVTELSTGSGWVAETGPFSLSLDDGTREILFQPVHLESCSAVHFTVLSPTSAVVAAALTLERLTETQLTIVELRNGHAMF